MAMQRIGSMLTRLMQSLLRPFRIAHPLPMGYNDAIHCSVTQRITRVFPEHLSS
jgi:hypothetical protein